MKFLNKHFQSIAKTTGKVQKLKLANRASVFSAETELFGLCVYQHFSGTVSTERPSPYCPFTFQKAPYCDQRTGIHYANQAVYKIIDSFDKSQILTFENLRKPLK
ncbi:YL1 nuclear protein C-terminal domain-containing protein [Spironucleus salmonicida]|uniref:YL1 nuclear protein C-terminal domain-containing protein n=1 Tax=Spironucleus salmonicida TaxID=348837 RepID=V6LID5_9EUKA|nr:YL1 nuclear protein C-terminal domain-containing protein [Spironucleus salmonicida]|eukprot:EST44302.1 YL1 nuclear protein C-terminal domain-containing protein [Spironucleus salmonicida]